MNPAMKRLMDGNRRYVSGQSTLDNSEARRIKVAYKQKPFAAVFCCSDSRVAPEIIFDQGLGDVFVVRTAGAVLDGAVLGSLELAVAEFRIPALVVLGHKRCGAVKLAIEVAEGSRTAGEHSAYLAEAIRPAMEEPPPQSKDHWDRAARRHVQTVVDRLRHSAGLEAEVRAGALEIVAGWYDLDTGIVEIIGG